MRPEQPQPLIGETAWALLDWTYSADRPQLAFVAGSLPGCRMVLDRFRRGLVLGNRAQVQFWCWSTAAFTLEANRTVAVPTEVYSPQAAPQSPVVRASFVPKELLVEHPPSGVSYSNASFPNTQTTTTRQMTIADRYHLIATVETIETNNAIVRIAQATTPRAPVRILAIAHHNLNW